MYDGWDMGRRRQYCLSMAMAIGSLRRLPKVAELSALPSRHGTLHESKEKQLAESVPARVDKSHLETSKSTNDPKETQQQVGG